MIETALIVGAWCLVSSAENGWNNLEKRYEPRTYIYERKVDCDPDRRLIIGPRGLKDYVDPDVSLSDDGKELIVEGELKRK
jgi:hypothetical protein